MTQSAGTKDNVDILREQDRRISRLERTVAAGDLISVSSGSITGSISFSQLTGTLTVADAADVDVGSIVGTLDASHAASIDVGSLVGTLTAGDVASINVGALDGQLIAEQIASVNANTITGGIAAAQITSVNAAAITGSILAAQIGSVNASAITGSITAMQIGSVNAGVITGTVVAAQIGSVNAGVITGGIVSSQISSVNAGSIGGTGQIGAAYINASNLAALSATLGSLTIPSANGSIVIGTAANGITLDYTGISGTLNSVTQFKLDRSTGKVMTLAGVGGFNLVPNSSFENPLNGLAGWNQYNGNFPNPVQATMSVVDAATWDLPTHGAKLLALLATTNTTAPVGFVLGDRAKVQPGEVYTLSVIGSNNLSVLAHGGHVHWYDAAGAIIGGGFSFSFSTNLTTSWERHKITTTAAPAGARTAAVYVWVVSGLANGYRAFYDQVQFEVGQIATAYAPKADEILPDTVTGVELAPNSVAGGQGSGNAITLVPNTIIGTDLIVDAIAAREIAAASIAAEHIVAGSLDTSRLSVGSLSNEIANGGFEDPASTATRPLPTSWQKGQVFGSAGHAYTLRTDENPAYLGSYIRSGKAAVYFYNPGGGGVCDLTSDPIAVSAGDTWYVSVWAKSNTGTSPGFYIRLRGGDVKGDSDIEINTYSNGVENVTVPIGWTKYSFNFVIPAGMYWMRAVLLNWSTNTGHELSVDDFVCRKAATGTTIEGGALDTHTITLAAGGKVRTAASGARVEMTSDGITKYDAGGATPVKLGPTDGLDLLAGLSSTPPGDRKIRWKLGSTTVAEVFGWTTGSTYGETNLRSFSPSTGLAASLYTAAGASVSQAGAIAGAATAMILDNAGVSDFQFASSDESMKRDICPLLDVDPDPVATINAISPRAFRWKEDQGPGGDAYGLVAQELREVLPEAVYEAGEDRHLTIQHAPIIAVLVAANQQLERRVAVLEREETRR